MWECPAQGADGSVGDRGFVADCGVCAKLLNLLRVTGGDAVVFNELAAAACVDACDSCTVCSGGGLGFGGINNH